MNKKITELPLADNLDGEVHIPIVQDGVTKKVQANKFVKETNYESSKVAASSLIKYIYGYRMTEEQMAEWWSGVSAEYHSLYGIANKLIPFFNGLDNGTSTIDKWRELEDFLSGITTEKSLAGLLENLKTSLQIEINKKASTLELTSEVNRATSAEGQKANKTELQGVINGKVDKIQGKGLTSNDFTTVEKNKLCNLATVATTGSYSDLSNKPDLTLKANITDFAKVAITGSYRDLYDSPITEITPDVMNRLTTSHASKVYILIDGTKRGLLIFECHGPSSARQILYMDGIVKKREALSMNTWQEWMEIGIEKKTLYIDSSTQKNSEGIYEVDLSNIDEFISAIDGLNNFQWVISALPISEKTFTKEIDCFMSSPGRIRNSDTLIIKGVTYHLRVYVYTGLSYSSGSEPTVNALATSIMGERGFVTENKRFKLFMSFEASTLTYTLTFIPIS